MALVRCLEGGQKNLLDFPDGKRTSWVCAIYSESTVPGIFQKNTPVHRRSSPRGTTPGWHPVGKPEPRQLRGSAATCRALQGPAEPCRGVPGLVSEISQTGACRCGRNMEKQPCCHPSTCQGWNSQKDVTCLQHRHLSRSWFGTSTYKYTYII